MLGGQRGGQLHVLVGVRGDLILSDGQVAGDGVDHAGVKLHEGVVVVANGLSGAALEGGGKLGLVALEHVKRSGVDLGHDSLAGQACEIGDVATGLHDDDLLIEHVGIGEGVAVLAALHGEAVPDAVDVALGQQRILGIPIDGGQLQLPAVLVAHGLSQIKVEAGVLAVVADEAVRRIALVEADRQGFLAVSGVAAGLVARARATRQQGAGQGQRGNACHQAEELLLHVPFPSAHARGHGCLVP